MQYLPIISLAQGPQASPVLWHASEFPSLFKVKQSTPLKYQFLFIHTFSDEHLCPFYLGFCELCHCERWYAETYTYLFVSV